MKEKIKKILRKNLLFILPLVLLILYFLYPIPITIYEGLSKTIHQKGEIDNIIKAYEQEEKLYQEAISPDRTKQCIEECRRDYPTAYRLSSCREECRIFTLEVLSPAEIEECAQKCIERESLTMCEKIYCSEHAMSNQYRRTKSTYDGFNIYEVKQSSFMGLFFKNFNKSFIPFYQKLIKNFHFQNIIIILLSLVLYYVVIFGIAFIKRLEKRT